MSVWSVTGGRYSEWSTGGFSAPVYHLVEPDPPPVEPPPDDEVPDDVEPIEEPATPELGDET